MAIGWVFKLVCDRMLMNEPKLALSVTERAERETEDLLHQIQEVRGEVLEKLTLLGTHAEALRRHVRSNPTELSGPLSLAASVYMRFVGAAIHGFNRTSTVDRVILRAKADQAETVRLEEERLTREASRKAKKAQALESNPVLVDDGDAFDELYGGLTSNA